VAIAPLITVDDVRAEGLDPGDADDTRVELTIGLVGEYFDIITGQWFEPVIFTTNTPLLVDGSGIDTLDLPAPVLQLDGIVENQIQLDLSNVVVYNRRRPDDRRYPRIVKKSVSALGIGGSGYYAGYYGGAGYYGPQVVMRWSYGPQMIALAGTFGYCEGAWRGAFDPTTTYAFDDAVLFNGRGYRALASSMGVAPDSDTTKWEVGLAPPLVKKTALRMVMRYWRLLTDPEEPEARSTARVMSESTDGHSYTLSGLIASAGLTGDPAIDDVLAMYRRRFGGTTRGVR
jgi:hypothetical protein